MNEEEKKRILSEIDVKRKELDVLKAKLEELNTVKESWFEKRRLASKEISGVVKSIREAKGKRNTFSRQVKDSKERRGELNTLINQKRNEMKVIQSERDDIAKKFGIRFDPAKIRKEIDDLELRIETEAVPFSIEQKIMKIIAEKKKVLEQSREVSSVFEKIHSLQKEIDNLKRKADESHRKVQTKAEASQQFHEELVESSKENKELREKEEEALKKFVESKSEYTKQNELVRAKIEEINALRALVSENDFENKKKAKKEAERKITDQKRSVEEKIQKGLKLTTEDLLAFQANAFSSEHNTNTSKKLRRDFRQKKRFSEEKKESQKPSSPENTIAKPEPAPESSEKTAEAEKTAEEKNAQAN